MLVPALQLLSPIICNLKFHVLVGWKMQKQVIDGRQEEYKKINHGKLTEGTRNGRRWKKWGNGKKKGGREAGRPPCCGVARETAFYGVTATRGGIGRHRAPEVTCYLAGSTWPGAEFNTKWSLRCCSLCQRSNKSDYYLSLQCVPIPLLDLYTLACQRSFVSRTKAAMLTLLQCTKRTCSLLST